MFALPTLLKRATYVTLYGKHYSLKDQQAIHWTNLLFPFQRGPQRLSSVHRFHQRPRSRTLGISHLKHGGFCYPARRRGTRLWSLLWPSLEKFYHDQHYNIIVLNMNSSLVKILTTAVIKCLFQFSLIFLSISECPNYSAFLALWVWWRGIIVQCLNPSITTIWWPRSLSI